MEGTFHYLALAEGGSWSSRSADECFVVAHAEMHLLIHLVRPSLKHQPDDGHSGAKRRSSHFKFFTANKLSDID